MYLDVPYEVVGYQNLHFFSIKGDNFVMVDLVIEDGEELKDVPFQTFREEKWWEIIDTKTVFFHECVPQNIMIGNYYS